MASPDGWLLSAATPCCFAPLADEEKHGRAATGSPRCRVGISSRRCRRGRRRGIPRTRTLVKFRPAYSDQGVETTGIRPQICGRRITRFYGRAWTHQRRVSLAVALDRPCFTRSANLTMTSHRKTIRHFHDPGDLHELTFSCYRRMPLLTYDVWREKLCRSIDKAITRWNFRRVACVLPRLLEFSL